nr:HEAT repeat domain-containing protein [Methanosarcina barkeri]
MIRLINDQDRNVRTCAAETLTTIFSDVPDKQQAYNDLIRLLTDQDDEVKSWPAKVLMDVFSDVPDKQQAYNDLIRLITDQNRKVRTYASYILKTIFSDVPDKQQAYNDLIRLLTDQNDEVKAWPAKVLMDVFSDVPDKQQAYYDLIRLITDQDRNVRTYAAETLTTIFSDVPDKQQAYNDLIRLLTDQDDEVKVWPAKVLMDVFSDVPDKQQAYNDLIRLLTDQDDNVKYWAFQILRYIYSDLPDKQQPWNELIKFAADESNDLRPTAVWVLSYMVSQVPDQQQAWNDLIKLTSDRSSLVCLRANYALGKVSIFKASRAENEESYKEKLENAISFFEKASKQSSNEFENPAQFCLPFYRSFHSIIFRRQEAKEEVGKYLTEAKDAIKGSKSKETLFEAVENLANALKTVQKLENLDFEAKKDELNFYRKYCDRAAELMKDAEETAPFATITLQKGLPILNKNLKELLEEIQKKAKIACKESVGTPEAEIACTINKEVQKWEISSPEKNDPKHRRSYLRLEKSSIRFS